MGAIERAPGVHDAMSLDTDTFYYALLRSGLSSMHFYHGQLATSTSAEIAMAGFAEVSQSTRSLLTTAGEETSAVIHHDQPDPERFAQLQSSVVTKPLYVEGSIQLSPYSLGV